jgi:hypothetical protein
MKITHIDGSSIDTNILPDTEAMVLEKVEEFRLFCLKNKVPFLMFVNSKGLGDSDFLAFWSFADRANNYEGDGRQTVGVDITPILKTINAFVLNATQGQLYLAQAPQE